MLAKPELLPWGVLCRCGGTMSAAPPGVVLSLSKPPNAHDPHSPNCDRHPLYAHFIILVSRLVQFLGVFPEARSWVERGFDKGGVHTKGNVMLICPDKSSSNLLCFRLLRAEPADGGEQGETRRREDNSFHLVGSGLQQVSQPSGEVHLLGRTSVTYPLTLP